VTDPYLIPGADCLENKLGLADPVRLRETEARIVSIRDVYPWAGEVRRVNISKDRSMFAAWQFVEDQTSAVLAGLEDDNWLIGVSRERFVTRLAHYYGELNVCHPFREGNGRTQRAFLRQLSAAAGWRLDWSALDKANNVAASEQALVAADFGLLRQVLEPVVVRM
jgi:cell filamentation protein